MRSKLFVPGSRPELFAKAMASEADGLSFDLEDAVDESMKGKAREEVARFLRNLPPDHGKTIIVRVNGLDTPHFAADVRAITGPGLDIVNLPKPDSADDVKACARAMNEAERDARVPVPAAILVNIETPKALRLASELAAASPRVVGLQAGWGDLIEPLDIDRYNPARSSSFSSRSASPREKRACGPTTARGPTSRTPTGIAAKPKPRGA